MNLLPISMIRLFRFFHRSSLLFGLIHVLSISFVHAQGSPTNQQLEKAQSLVEQGQQAMYRKQYLKGIKAYQQAHQIIPDPTNLYIIARAYGAMKNQCKETLKAWTLFFKGCAECNYREDGLRRQAKQEKRCLATLKITTNHTQLEIKIDQKNWQVLKGGSSYVVKGVVGQSIKVKSQLKGYFPALKTLTFKPSQQTLLYQIDLVAIPNPQPLVPAWSAWTLIGLGVASVGWGIFQYKDARSYTDRYRGMETELKMYQTGKKQFEQIADKSYLSLGVGSGLIIAGSALLVYKKRPTVSQKQYVSKKPIPTRSSFTFSLSPFSSSFRWQF